MAKALAVAMLVAVALVVAAATGASADNCHPHPEELTPCANAVQYGFAPSAECCAKLRAQLGCACYYASSSGNARRMLTACGIPISNC